MGAGHTPGPWEAVNVEDAPDDAIAIIGRPTWPCERFGERGVWDVATAPDLGEENVAEQIANARLIAAAPDLLEALEYLVSLGGGDCLDPARAAIAKARGEQP